MIRNPTRKKNINQNFAQKWANFEGFGYIVGFCKCMAIGEFFRMNYNLTKRIDDAEQWTKNTNPLA